MSVVKRTLLVFVTATVTLFACLASGKDKPLVIYCIDVEGGQATLLVAPSGQSLLVDTGWPDFGGRDAARIASAARDAGVSQIDYVLITHYHADHVGGVPQLARAIKVGTFVDHGTNQEDTPAGRILYEAYQQVVAQHEHIVAKPGDRIPLKGLDVRVLTAAGERIAAPLGGAGQPNPLCDSEPEAAVDATENARSLGTLITFGKFRFLDLGDLTRRKELELACPNNLVGTVDLYLVSHHGLDASNSRALVHALHPRVAIMNNGAHKGGIPQAWQIVHDSPGLEDLWQLHYALDADAAHNSAESLIANMEAKCEGKYIKVTAQSDGSFTVVNSRNGFSKSYGKP